ncbi:MAG TPA: bifunctional 4-hydroxy-2-oxoglutarate aldolase/2-dehydro-3-deoxy-phosphogluconate aldolase [Candidatus Limnocylindria bacterium]
MRGAELRGGPAADAIRQHRLIAILRRVEPRERLLALVDELAEAGVRVFEVTLDAATGAEDLASVRERLAGRAGAVVGAGTILRRSQLDDALMMGADFGVAPIFDAELTRGALEASLPFVPGGMTPTEIRLAWEAGATFVKLFPASAVGPTFVRELRGPLPDLALIPTGGIDAVNAASFLSAGAAAIGIGSALAHADAATRRALVRSVMTGAPP